MNDQWQPPEPPHIECGMCRRGQHDRCRGRDHGCECGCAA